MSSKTETAKSSGLDTLLLLVAILLLVGGIVGYYYFADQAVTVVRALGLLATVGVAALVAGMTAKGKALFRFFKEADIERRKVVWPTWPETWQTTLMVIVVTIIIAIMLFFIDMFLGWSVRQLIG